MPDSITTRSNYIGVTAAELGQTQDLESTGAFSGTTIGIGDKYMIDLYGNMMTYKADRTPLLSILSNLGSISERPPYIVWNDEYSGEMWWDIAIDNLRLRDTKLSSGDTALSPFSGSVSTVTAGTSVRPITDSSYAGGKLPVLTAKTLSATTAINILAFTTVSTTITVPTFVGATSTQAAGMAFCPGNNRGADTAVTNKLFIAFKKDNDNTVGGIETVWNRLHQIMLNMNYTKYASGTNATGNVACTRFDYSSSAHAPLYMAFDEIHLATGTELGLAATADAGTLTKGTIETFYEAMILINKCGYFNVGTTSAYLFFELDIDVSNISPASVVENYLANTASSGATGTCDAACVAIPYPTGTVATTGPFSLFLNTARTAAEYMGKMSRMIHVGRKMSAPLPLPEGDTFAAGGNFTAYRERLTNFSQIFATPKYGITGTHQASQFRFGDDFQRSRAMWLEIYKGMKESAFLFGVKSENVVTGATNNSTFMTGQPVRTLGGLMDYALFPINFMKKSFTTPTYSDNAATLATFIGWFDDIADRLTSFRHNSAQDFTFLVSKQFLRKLIPFTRAYTASSVMMGGQVQVAKPSQLTFGLEIFSFVTSSGSTIKFIHEPSLDTLPSLPVPYWLFGATNLNPRDVLISIDTNNIKQVLCRPDRIYGNIQEIGQDAFMEGMRGESSFILRYPKNHSIIYAPSA